MIVTRYFIRHTSDDTGMNGFVPLWIPSSANFDPTSSPLGLLHDALEHRLCDTGKVHEEAMAFGRILATRPYSGHNGSPRSLGTEFSGVVYRAWQDGNVSLIDDALTPAPRVDKHLLGGQEKGELQDFMAAFHKGLKSEIEHDDADDPAEPTNVLNTRLARWVSIGFADARRRYGGESGCYEVGYLFNFAREKSQERKLENLVEHTEEDDCLRLVIDTKEGKVKYTPLYQRENYSFGHPDWLAARVRQWKYG